MLPGAAELSEGFSCCCSGSYSSRPPQPCPRMGLHERSSSALPSRGGTPPLLQLQDPSLAWPRLSQADLLSESLPMSLIFLPHPSYQTDYSQTQAPIHSGLRKYLVQDCVICIGCCGLKVFLTLLFPAFFPGTLPHKSPSANPVLVPVSCQTHPDKTGNCTLSVFSKEQFFFSIFPVKNANCLHLLIQPQSKGSSTNTSNFLSSLSSHTYFYVIFKEECFPQNRDSE